MRVRMKCESIPNKTVPHSDSGWGVWIKHTFNRRGVAVITEHTVTHFPGKIYIPKIKSWCIIITLCDNSLQFHRNGFKWSSNFLLDSDTSKPFQVIFKFSRRNFKFISKNTIFRIIIKCALHRLTVLITQSISGKIIIIFPIKSLIGTAPKFLPSYSKLYFFVVGGNGFVL